MKKARAREDEMGRSRPSDCPVGQRTLSALHQGQWREREEAAEDTRRLAVNQDVSSKKRIF